MNKKVDAYLKSEKKWKAEVTLLREIALASKLEEELKWGLPCYTANGKNVAVIQSFKNFCALMFFNGNQLEDTKGLLMSPGPNSQTARRLEFKSTEEISKLKTTIKSYLLLAAKLDKVEAKPKTKALKPEIPAEFETVLKKNKKLKIAFEALTPGRQRLYLIHFSSAKQSETRSARVQKCIPKIMEGLGLNE